VTEPFKTLAEVRAYLSGEKVRCLMCGLHTHVQRAHMPVDEYKASFGIPQTYGLVGVYTKALLSVASKTRQQQLPPEERIEALAARSSGSRAPRRPHNEATRAMYRANGLRNVAIIREKQKICVTVPCVTCGAPLERKAVAAAHKNMRCSVCKVKSHATTRFICTCCKREFAPSPNQVSTAKRGRRMFCSPDCYYATLRDPVVVDK
jgi:hypothetical protein